MRRIVIAVLLVSLAAAPLARAQWAVIDVAAIAQSLENTIQTAAVVANTAREVEAQYNIILRQIEQYETMIRNLQRLPEGMNVLQIVQLWSGQINALLSHANIVSYNMESVRGQFQQLYEQLGTIQQAADVLAVRHRLLNGRMEAAGITVHVTAIKQNLTELYSRMCGLLDQASISQGNLDIQQVQAMQNGLIQHTLESMATMQAAHARNTAQYHAEQGAMERLHLQAIQAAMGKAALLGEPQGALPRFHW